LLCNTEQFLNKIFIIIKDETMISSFHIIFADINNKLLINNLDRKKLFEDNYTFITFTVNNTCAKEIQQILDRNKNLY